MTWIVSPLKVFVLIVYNMRIFFHIRYYLEIVSVPIFAFLIVHLAGHGSMLFLESDHDHGHHYEDAHHASEGLLADIFTLEALIGVIFMVIFVLLWHTKVLRRFVPCSHDHCHTGVSISHLFARKQHTKRTSIV